jgi:hypothetical protein
MVRGWLIVLTVLVVALAMWVAIYLVIRAAIG